MRRVEIPKDKKSKRPLGIPTVADWVVQQSTHQVLLPIYERQFSNNSFGFHPKRSTHKVLFQCKLFISQEYKYAIDLAKFFDTVNHSKLIKILSHTVKGSRVISLIHRYINLSVVVKNKFEKTEFGVHQGGSLSALLSDIILNGLDKELHK